VAGGAARGLESEPLGARKIVPVAQDVVDLRAAPAIDRLVVVADAADVLEGGGGRYPRERALLPLPACGERETLREYGLRRVPLTPILSPQAGRGSRAATILFRRNTR